MPSNTALRGEGGLSERRNERRRAELRRFINRRVNGDVASLEDWLVLERVGNTHHGGGRRLGEGLRGQDRETEVNCASPGSEGKRWRSNSESNIGPLRKCTK